jgi:hypothetical protein
VKLSLINHGHNPPGKKKNKSSKKIYQNDMQKLKPDFEEVSPLKMIPLSLKLNPTVLDNMEAVRARIRQNRNTYINLAIDVYNNYHRYSMMKKLVEGES